MRQRVSSFVGRPAPRIALAAALSLLSTAAMATNLTGGNGYLYDVMSSGYLSNGTSDAYDGMYRLRVNGNEFGGSLSGTSADGRELYTTAYTDPTSGVSVERRIYVPAQDDFARYTEILTNGGSSAATVSVEVFGNLGSDSNTTTITDGGHYRITDDSSDGNGGYDPTLVHYFAPSGGGALPPVDTLTSDNLSWSWSSVTVPANSTVRLVYFISQTANAAAASAAVAQFDANGYELYENMTSTEQGQVINFNAGGTGGSTGAFPTAQFVSVPLSTSGTLSSTDPYSVYRTSSYADVYGVNLSAGQSVTVSMASIFDTYLNVYDGTGARVAYNDDSNGTLNSEVVYTATATGSYYIEATSFSSGVTGGYTLDILGSAQNQPPVANFNYTAASYEAPADVVFSDISSDPEGSIYQRCWDFGDGTGISCTSSQSVTHTYQVAGNYVARLTVQDGGGLYDDVTQTVSISAPAASGEGSIAVGDSVTGDLSATDRYSLTRTSSYADGYRISLNAGEEVVIDLTASFDTYLLFYDASYTLVRSNDDGGDGLNSRIIYTPTTSGTYIIEASSYSGGSTGAYNLSVVSSGNSAAVTTVDINATASASNPLTQTLLVRMPSGNDPSSVRWDMGDGTVFDLFGSTAGVTSHTYASAGVYTVSVTVVDSVGTSLSGTAQVIVSTDSVTANFAAASLTGEAPFTVDFIDTSTSTYSGDTLTYEWNFGDGQYSTDRSPSHEFTAAGVYDVTLTVTSLYTGQSADYVQQVTVVDSSVSTSDVPVTGVVRLRPQVVMAGFDPILIDLADSTFKIFAYVRPGALPVSVVQFNQNQSFLAMAMTHVATTSAGDQRWEANLTFPRGSFPIGAVGDLFGDRAGEFNVQVVDQGQQTHGFPDLEFGNNPQLTTSVTSPYLAPSTQAGIRRLQPQLLGAGFDPPLVDLADTSFQIRALVRAGVVGIQSVSFSQNTSGLAYSMTNTETYANGDQEYRATLTYPRGSFPATVLGALFGTRAGEFNVVVTDQGQQTHGFPNLSFGNYLAQ